MLNKGLNYWTELFCLGLIFISSREVLSQECSEPQVANSIFAGTTHEGDFAAIICNTGYEGGGVIDCQGGNWLSLPQCTPRACPELNVAIGNLTGELFLRGSANVNCDPGYEGGGAAVCGSNGAWVTVPTCTPIDPQVANGNLTGDNFYDGTASIECYPGYEGGGSFTCQSNGVWGAKPSCDPKNCWPLTIPKGVFSGDIVYAGNASVPCEAGYDFGGVVECVSDGKWATPSPTCFPKDTY